ncbi:MAG: prolyl oligopeptidase family serine peptidase [Gammaproteobacteria bacterium]|nr:prolyl oligopeptidase family serine peptidase [Gammaproteobacteria bacterium]
MARPALRLLAIPLAIAALLGAPQALAREAAAAGQSTESTYRLPPPELQAIVDAPQAPQMTLSPRRDLLAFVETPALPGIDVVAQPELRLAGTRINPRTYSQSRFSFGTGLSIKPVDGGAERPVQGLPQPLALASMAWSPDQRHIAFSHVDNRAGAVELWLVDVEALSARRLTSQPLNAVAGRGFTWMPDAQRLLVQLRPAGQGGPPQDEGIPTGPNIQETGPGGEVTQLRTYQDLLANEHDAQVFEHYLRSQTALVALDGSVTPLGAPDLFLGVSPSPDGRLLLSQRIERPFSYVVPYWSFPRRIEVRDSADGSVVHQVAALPLVEGLPVGRDAVATGVRRIDWRADAPATLVWAEAQDGGDPAVEAEVRDSVFVHAAPFEGEPVKLIDLGYRFRNATWGNGGLALIDEFWWRDRQTRQWRIAPDHPERAPELLFDRSSEDRYNDPGSPVTVADEAGNARLMISPDGNGLYLAGQGASPEGDRPFVDRFDLATKETTRLFHSQPPYLERPAALLDDAGTRLLLTRESPVEPTNVYVLDLTDDAREPVALTGFPHPTPQLRDVSKEQIRYKRADGVDLTATLYLPAGYDAERDGPLPTLMWAYPREFRSADAASQVVGSPHAFNRISYWGPLGFLARGWAVLDGPTMPIVGEGDAEPNDTYVEQLVASARAAVDEVVRRGVADPDRIAIGGHSYGAFMTANLLAHSDLFRAGIARSGAYNRTLTPFGFQAEERNYWDAKDTYLTMSPFHNAELINEPILFIHGEDDNNSGTFPMQSERMFAAIKGLGGQARLVMLPAESHGYRARESILHMLYETDAWLEQHVKQSPAAWPANNP